MKTLILTNLLTAATLSLLFALMTCNAFMTGKVVMTTGYETYLEEAMPTMPAQLPSKKR